MMEGVESERERERGRERERERGGARDRETERDEGRESKGGREKEKEAPRLPRNGARRHPLVERGCLDYDALPSHRASSSLLGPVDPLFQALAGRLQFTVRRHKFDKDSLLPLPRNAVSAVRHARTGKVTGVPRS